MLLRRLDRHGAPHCEDLLLDEKCLIILIIDHTVFFFYLSLMFFAAMMAELTFYAAMYVKIQTSDDLTETSVDLFLRCGLWI